MLQVGDAGAGRAVELAAGGRAHEGNARPPLRARPHRHRSPPLLTVSERFISKPAARSIPRFFSAPWWLRHIGAPQPSHSSVAQLARKAPQGLLPRTAERAISPPVAPPHSPGPAPSHHGGRYGPTPRALPGASGRPGSSLPGTSRLSGHTPARPSASHPLVALCCQPIGLFLR